jgi:hypothetical protein
LRGPRIDACAQLPRDAGHARGQAACSQVGNDLAVTVTSLPGSIDIEAARLGQMRRNLRVGISRAPRARHIEGHG